MTILRYRRGNKRITLRTFSSDEALVNERRIHIVRCSTKIWTKKGYDQTNMRELAKACAMSTGALYHYFGSKEEILYSIISSASSRQAEYMEQSVKDLENERPKNALNELIKIFFQWHEDNQDVTLFIYQETKNLPQNARTEIFESEGRIQAAFVELLKRGSEAGEFQIKDPGIIAHSIMVLGHAWALRRWFLRKHWNLESYLKEETDIILKAISRSEQVGQ